MASLLVMAKNNTHIDPIVDKRGCYKKGYIVVVKPDNYTPSRSECLPSFVVVKIPEVTEEVARNYMHSWDFSISLTVLSSNLTTADYHVEAVGNNMSVSGEAAVTREGVESFLTNWNAVVASFSTNSVIFDINLWQALQSKGFWDTDVSAFTFVLDDYDSGTGIADVTVSGFITPEQIVSAKRLIEQKGCVVLNETATSVSFAAERQDVIDEFINDVEQATRQTHCRKQWYISESVIDQAIAMQDTFDGETQLTWKGQIELTQAEILAALNNKLDE